MTRGVALYLVGSIVLVALAGCGRSWFEEREPWRSDAEIACLQSGAVKEGAGIVRMRRIDGPGACGADYPLKVAVLGESGMLGYGPELRPPAPIPGAASYPPQLRAPAPAYPPASYPAPAYPRPVSPAEPPQVYQAEPPADTPLSLEPPGVHAREVVDDGFEDGGEPPPSHPYGQGPYRRGAAPASPAPLGPPQVPLGGPTTVKPAATLACPIVSALDRWIADSVQSAAMRWFGQPVVEIKQISAYSCRTMNGQRGAKTSEHAYGNAIDVAAFTFADGRSVTVKKGWRGLPEEQGFLRDVHAAACAQFSTVLGPGADIFHYDHLHLDLARRRSGRSICKPKAVPGDAIARRGADPTVTGSIGRRPLGYATEERFDHKLPLAIPGED